MSLARADDDALARLERGVAEAAAEPLVRISGVIAEVSPSHARVAGLSPFLKLGDCVSFGAGASRHRAEVVRIDAQGASIKAFELDTLTSLGARVTREGPLRLAPHPSWKGRVINALGVPIDAAGPLQQGEAPVEINAAPPPRHAPRADRATLAHRHPRHRSLHAHLRRAAHRHFRRLRRRQIDPSRHARRRARL